MTPALQQIPKFLRRLRIRSVQGYVLHRLMRMDQGGHRERREVPHGGSLPVTRFRGPTAQDQVGQLPRVDHRIYATANAELTAKPPTTATPVSSPPRRNFALQRVKRRRLVSSRVQQGSPRDPPPQRTAHDALWGYYRWSSNHHEPRVTVPPSTPGPKPVVRLPPPRHHTPSPPPPPVPPRCACIVSIGKHGYVSSSKCTGNCTLVSTIDEAVELSPINMEVDAPPEPEPVPESHLLFNQMASSSRPIRPPRAWSGTTIDQRYKRIASVPSLANPPPFFYHCRLLAQAEEAIADAVARKLKDAEMRPIVEKRDHYNHLAFRSFAYSLGAQVESFDKRESDRALSEMLGAVGIAATGTFRYQEFVTTDPIVAFSLYMGRKVFSPANPLHPPDIQPYYDRMTTPPAAPLPSKAVLFFERLARILCRRPRSFCWSKQTISASPKSCIERTSLEGGKRVSLFVEHDAPFRDKRGVIAKVIYTGGKHRTIGVNPAATHQFSVLNRIMGKRLRGFKSAIFGREVEDWVADVEENILRHAASDDFTFVSGDLKSATDLLHRDIARIFCDELVNQFDLDEDQSELLRGYTYQARYYERRYLSVVKVRACGCFDPEKCDHFLEQVGGWNMASDVSFPILCGASMYILITAAGRMDEFLAIVDEEKRKEWLTAFDEGGFNGDDVALWGPKEREKSWLEAVVSINGVPEPAKSPSNPVYFTVNSRLFALKNGKVGPMRSVHPGKLVHILGGAPSSPDAHWVDLLNCRPKWRRELGVDLVLRPRIPVQLGGVGLYRPTLITQADIESVLWFEATRPDFVGKTQHVNIGGETTRRECHQVGAKVKVKKGVWKDVMTRQYGSPKGLYWSFRPSERRFDDALLAMVLARAEDPIIQKKVAEKLNLYWDAEEEGCVVVSKDWLPWDVPCVELKG